MSNQTPVQRPVSWVAVLPQVFAAVFFVAVAYVLLPPASQYISFTLGLGLYLAYSFGSRLLLTRAHTKGRQLAVKGQYEQAIAKFEQSYNFFSKYPWVDRFRALTMMTPAAMEYREMALVNIAYCYVQLRKVEQARKYYQRLLTEYPNNPMAQKSLDYLDKVDQMPRKNKKK